MTKPGTDWLVPSDIGAWLKLPAGTDDALLAQCAAAVQPQIERARADQRATDGTYQPDREVYQAAVMVAARLYRRRNSPAGIEAFADSVAYVARFDPDIDRALRQGAYTPPRIG